ncbi:U3 snoRNP protein [Friedmanniomyces endolithicus]|nr:U3 snoRNP protein [Friedmanniomyces endolithicus]
MAGPGMKAAKPSKVVKPMKKRRRTTATSKKFRFQGFAERIANLKIDPIRRRRGIEGDEELTTETVTYLGRSLSEWRDLNLSTTFTLFIKDMAPYCDSLPMVLHNQDTIMDLLVAYIGKSDALAMEPLLSLLSHFAHDLGKRFEENHFHRAVSTVAAVAAKHDDPAVVEWSFTCLAWMFKYLSRYLVKDLRPLYDLLAPYLGKEMQKPFIIRFAAESLSFLVRKAAATYERDPEPLDSIINRLLQDCAETAGERAADLHHQGVLTLLTETIKGVQLGIHSSGTSTVRSLLVAWTRLTGNKRDVATAIVKGTLTSLLHHTNADTFRPILDTVIAYIDTIQMRDQESLRFAGTLMFTVVSVRKGTRVADWKRVVTSLKAAFAAADQLFELEEATATTLLSVLAVILQSASVDVVLPALSLLETVRKGRWSAYFLRFCDFCARLGPDNFRQYVYPQLRKFTSEQWQTYEVDIYRILPHLASAITGMKLKVPASCQSALSEQIANVASGVESSETDIAKAHALLAAMPYLELSEQTLQELSLSLEKVIDQALDVSSAASVTYRSLALGPCLERRLAMQKVSDAKAHWWPRLCALSAEHFTHAGFWANILRDLTVCDSAAPETSLLILLEQSLVQALALPSHEVRERSLEILAKLHELNGGSVPDAVRTALAIESTPISLASSRAISMSIRKLAIDYQQSVEDGLIHRAIPTYCFGLLHLKLAQAWDDAISTIIDICKDPRAEEIVVSVAQAWLDGSPDMDGSAQRAQPLTILSEGFNVVSDFECSNLGKLSAISRQVFDEPDCGYLSMQEQIERDQKGSAVFTLTSRSQALRVLDKVPQLAEKRSRMLVPVLLRWAGTTASESDDIESAGNRWARKDQKAMLAIFARFNNPRVLYKSAEVYEALLNLCANGDAEIQRSALGAIFSWKTPAINRYEEHLVNILDEARFREEVSVFLQEGESDETIRPVDYPILMPVLLRLLYGRAVAGGKHEQGSRRKAIFVALARFGQDTVGTFVSIATACVPNHLPSNGVAAAPLQELESSPRQQLGMLNMLNDMLDTLGSDLEPFASDVMRAVLESTVAAARKLDDSTVPQDASLLRSIRQTGIQCLVHIYADMDVAQLGNQAHVILEEIVRPRLANFAPENMQSVSGMLRLFGAWAASPHTTSCLSGDENENVLPHIAELLGEPNAKDEVRLFVLRDILDKLLSEENAGSTALDPHVTNFVKSIGRILSGTPSKDVLDAAVRTLTSLADRIEDRTEAQTLIHVCGDLLIKPSRLVSPGTKSGLLATLLPLLNVADTTPHDPVFEAVSGLFSRLPRPESRRLLSDVLIQICNGEGGFSEVAGICSQLNAQSERLGQPDHDQREHGFAQISEKWKDFSARQWLPILHNCLFYLADIDDLVNRSSAAQALRLFVKAAANNAEALKPMVSQVLIPGIEHGLKTPTELVRAEYLGLLGQIVENLPEWQAVSDMSGLTSSTDEEASFFNSALHIQQHRRLRALRSLGDEASHISSSNVTRLFLPFLEHFILDPAGGDAGRALADQAVVTVGSLAGSLNWSAYRATFKRYVGYISTKEALEKTVLRLLGAFVDALKAKLSRSTDGVSNIITPNQSENVKVDFLPPMLAYLHRKDESTVDRRMPVAVTVVKLMQLLPAQELSERLPAVLTDVAQVLRSRSQEARDQTRKTLATILTLVGPQYLGFILKELRGALLRGYQLHVLSFTVHSLLVRITETCQPGDLDHCLPDLTSIIMDDIFGITGQEKDAEEYKSGMKEVKSSKSFDTMELLARVTPIKKLGFLMQPLRALLTEKLDSKLARKVDELLTRLRKGVDQNPDAGTRDLLTFCHEIVRQVYAEQHASSASGVKLDYKVRKYLIQMESANKSKSKGATTSQLFKLSTFALNMVRKVVRKHEDLLTPGNMAGFLPMIGDAMVEGQEEVKLAAIRLLAAIVRVPLAELDKNGPVYVKEAVALIKGAPSMTSDSAKAALELVTAFLRARQSVTVKEADIAHVLKALKPDIDEPDRQGITYKFLRAILGRKIVITEVYDIMDDIGKVMVTNSDRSIRESARSAYLQFILDYPQGKDRWAKQTAFLVENLRYQHASGRQSVMELVHQLLIKLSDEVLAQLAFTFFVSLVPVQISDADPACRQMAGILIAKLFERAEEEQLKSFMALIEKWSANDKKPMIQIAALQCWQTYFKTGNVPVSQQEKLRQDIARSLANEDVVVGPQLLQALLDTFTVMVEVASATAFAAASATIWESVRQCLTATNADVQGSAATLIGAYFSHLASSSAQEGEGLAMLPLIGSGGLKLDATGMRHTCLTCLQSLMVSSDQTNESLTAQTLRNLAFLGRCFAANGMPWQAGNETNVAELEDDADEEEVAEVAQQASSALGYLLGQLSYILRQENLPVPARVAALQCQAAIVNQLQSIPNLQSLIRPLYVLTEPSLTQPATAAHRDFIDKARELLDLVQKKIGAETYIAALGEARKGAQTKREERRRKRKVEAVSAPEKWAKAKKRKHEMQKATKKAGNAEMRGRRRGW